MMSQKDFHGNLWPKVLKPVRSKSLGQLHKLNNFIPIKMELVLIGFYLNNMDDIDLSLLLCGRLTYYELTDLHMF